jgi:hypothetical protein
MIGRKSSVLVMESALALLAGGGALLTLVHATWIETVLGVDPDAGSGAVEWAIVVALAVLCLSMSLMARREYRRRAATVAR